MSTDEGWQERRPVGLDTHRCSGCGLRWTNLPVAELCGDCWRKAQPVVHAKEDTVILDKTDIFTIAQLLGRVESVHALAATGKRVLELTDIFVDLGQRCQSEGVTVELMVRTPEATHLTEQLVKLRGLLAKPLPGNKAWDASVRMTLDTIAEHAPETGDLDWYCTACGTVNGKNDDQCVNCYRVRMEIP